MYDAVVKVKSVPQRIMELYQDKADLLSATQSTQDMIYVYRLLKNTVWKVRFPIIIEFYKQVAIDLAKNWSVGGITRHSEVRHYFLIELKE